MSNELIAILIGIAIGSISSIIGAGTSYGMYLRQGDNEQTSGPLGIMLVITGTLVIVGFIAIVIGVYVGQLMQAILTGVGVFIGIAVSFMILVFIWQRIAK